MLASSGSAPASPPARTDAARAARGAAAAARQRRQLGDRAPSARRATDPLSAAKARRPGSYGSVTTAPARSATRRTTGLLRVRQVLEALHVERRAVPGRHLAGQQVAGLDAPPRRIPRSQLVEPRPPGRVQPREILAGARRPPPRRRTRPGRRAPSRAGRTAGRAASGNRAPAAEVPIVSSCTPAIRRASSSRRRAGRQPARSAPASRTRGRTRRRTSPPGRPAARRAASSSRSARHSAGSVGTTSRPSRPPPGWRGAGGTAPPPSPRSRDRRSARVALAEDTSVEVAEGVVHAPPRLVVEGGRRRSRLGRAAGAARPARARPPARCPPTPTASGTSQANRPEPSVGVVARIRWPNWATSASLTCCFVQPGARASASMKSRIWFAAGECDRSRRVPQTGHITSCLDLVLRELRRGGDRGGHGDEEQQPGQRQQPPHALARLRRWRRGARRRRSGPGTTRPRGPRGRSRTSPGSR